MRTILLLFALLTAGQLLAGDPAAGHASFQVKGIVNAPQKGKTAYLYIHGNAKQPARLLNTPVVNGRFMFSGLATKDYGGVRRGRLFFHDKPNMTLKEQSALYQQKPMFKFRDVILEPSVTVTIDNTVDQAQVAGSTLNEEFSILHAIQQQESKDWDSLSNLFKETAARIKEDKDAILKLKADHYKGLIAIEDRKSNAIFSFIKTHPTSPLALQYLKLFVRINNTPDMKRRHQQQLDDCIATLPADVKATSEMQKVIADAAKAPPIEGKLTVGGMAPEYVFKTGDAQSVSLKDFRGKHVLIDFWTSWCGPCRAEHYNIKQVYQQYKDKGFTILQVSFDKTDAPWKKALAEDVLPWTHVRCLQGWDKQVAELYDVRSVPTNYLIDPEGKIIAANLRGNALQETLQKVLP